MKSNLVRFWSYVFVISGFLTPSIRGQDKSEDFFTNVYTVPPTFGNQNAGVARDPFADAAPLPGRTPAKKILETAGVYFPDGGSAVYNPKTSQLIVRNTKEQMDLVAAFVDGLTIPMEKQIHLKVFFIEVEEPLWEGLEEPHVDDEKISEFSSFLPESELPTSRMMKLLEAPDLEEAIKNEAVVKRSQNLAEGTAKPAGVFSDPQLEVFLESKEKTLGFEKVHAPSGCSRSGQRAFIQTGDHALVVDSVIGADNFTIDLNIASRQRAELESKDRKIKRCQITLWDAQTVALAEETAEGKFIYTFVRPQILDPAGIPINEQPKEIPEKE